MLGWVRAQYPKPQGTNGPLSLFPALPSLSPCPGAVNASPLLQTQCPTVLHSCGHGGGQGLPWPREHMGGEATPQRSSRAPNPPTFNPCVLLISPSCLFSLQEYEFLSMSCQHAKTSLVQEKGATLSPLHILPLLSCVHQSQTMRGHQMDKPGTAWGSTKEEQHCREAVTWPRQELFSAKSGNTLTLHLK